MLSAGGTSYAYDGMSNRISQMVGSIPTSYLLDLQPGLAVVLGDSGGNRYVHAPSGIHAQRDAGNNWGWMIQDGLRSIRSVIDDNFEVLESRLYAPYGGVFGTSGHLQTAYDFTGEMRDVNDLLYLRARYYAPHLGAFTALDPFEGFDDSPMSLNGYSWVEGNVPNAVDPSGLLYEFPQLWDNCSISPFNKNVFRKPALSLPLNVELPEWFTQIKTRICDELCPELRDSRNGIRPNCRVEFNRICHLLCADEPIDFIDRDADSYEHKGLITRWMNYYQNPLDLTDQRSHRNAYTDVQKRFDRAMGQWNLGRCGGESESAPAQELNRLAEAWRTRGLENPSIAVAENPQRSPQYRPQYGPSDLVWLSQLYLATGLGFASAYILSGFAGGGSTDYATP